MRAAPVSDGLPLQRGVWQADWSCVQRMRRGSLVLSSARQFCGHFVGDVEIGVHILHVVVLIQRIQ